MNSRKVSYKDKFLDDKPLKRDGIVLKRDADGTIWTNVPHNVVHHSPGGFEWGYQGSGCADLALNIVEAVLEAEDWKGLRTFSAMWDKSHPFAQSWALHQSFKMGFLVKIPRQPGTYVLSYHVVRDWIMGHVLPEDTGDVDLL